MKTNTIDNPSYFSPLFLYIGNIRETCAISQDSIFTAEHEYDYLILVPCSHLYLFCSKWRPETSGSFVLSINFQVLDSVIDVKI